MKRLFALAAGTAFSLGLVSAGAAADVAINVHTGTGVVPHMAPTLGALPLSLEDAMKAAGMKFTVSWFASVPGYAVMIIDKEPATTTGEFAASYWWACVDGYSAAAGLQTLVKSGAVVDWFFGQDGKCPKG